MWTTTLCFAVQYTTYVIPFLSVHLVMMAVHVRPNSMDVYVVLELYNTDIPGNIKTLDAIVLSSLCEKRT